MVKKLPASAGDPGGTGGIPGLGGSPGGGNDNPLQYSPSVLLVGYSPWGHKESDVTECTHTLSSEKGGL